VSVRSINAAIPRYADWPGCPLSSTRAITVPQDGCTGISEGPSLGLRVTHEGESEDLTLPATDTACCRAPRNRPLPPFTEAVVSVGVLSVIALYAIPNLEAAYSATEQALPTITQLILGSSPLGLIAVSIALGLGSSIGRLKEDYRWISWTCALLILLVGVTLVVGLMAPLMGG